MTHPQVGLQSLDLRGLGDEEVSRALERFLEAHQAKRCGFLIAVSKFSTTQQRTVEATLNRRHMSFVMGAPGRYRVNAKPRSSVRGPQRSHTRSESDGGSLLSALNRMKDDGEFAPSDEFKLDTTVDDCDETASSTESGETIEQLTQAESTESEGDQPPQTPAQRPIIVANTSTTKKESVQEQLDMRRALEESRALLEEEERFFEESIELALQASVGTMEESRVLEHDEEREFQESIEVALKASEEARAQTIVDEREFEVSVELALKASVVEASPKSELELQEQREFELALSMSLQQEEIEVDSIDGMKGSASLRRASDRSSPGRGMERAPLRSLLERARTMPL